MGILSAGLKKAAKASRSISNKDYTPPKKDINPLLKQMDQMFTLDEPNKIAEFYSPVISAIDKMPIALEGTKGENIIGYLNKRAPNVSKAELESFSLQLDPQQKYTREQVKELAKQQGSEKYVVEVIDPKKVPYFDEIELDEVEGTDLEDVGNFRDWRKIQRQNPIDKEVGFIGLKLQGEKNYYKNDNTHFGGVENVGHSRSSIREVMPEGGPLQQKIKDRETYLFIEEAQSDVAKSQQDVLLNREKFREDGKYTETKTIYPNSPDDLIELDKVVTRDTISDLQYEAEQSNISIDPAVVKTINDFFKAAYKDVYFYDNFKEVQRKNTELAEELRDKLKEKHNLTIHTGKTPQKVAERATLESLSEWDTGKRIEPGTHPFEGEVTEIWEMFPETLEREAKYNSNLELDPKEISSEIGYKGTLKSIQKLSPVQTRSEYLKKLLLANIAYAKQQGINKVVIPDYREIARARVPNFIDEIETGTNRELYTKYYEAVEKGTGEQFKQNYYETIFKPLYKDALKKVTNELKSETKGAIKVKSRNIKYKDLTEKNGFRNSNATELDITNFEFDPSTQQIRFAEGGAVPMEEQMKLFEQGGLRDEGGMVDEVSGNDVPIGSTRKEVRDDIPAMLSEGEFVFPADVVRYIGLEKLMKIRQNAKQGLKKMEEMGQMGNSDEATMPDDLPFGMMDLIIVEGEEEEPEEKAHGGVVHMQKGGFTVPKFDPRNQDVRQYENAEGKKLNIPFLGGKPVYPIPEGYFPVGTVVEEEKDETKEAIPTDDDPRDPSGVGQVTNAFTEAGSWEGSPLDMYIKEAEKVSTFGNVAAGVMTATVPVLGAFVALANKNQKKRILATIDARIEEAKKTDVPGQVKALREVKDRLTKDERKGILGGIVGEIIDGIADGLGLSKAEKVTAKVTSSYNATVDPTEPDKNTTDTQEQILNELNNKGFTEEFSFGSLVPKSGEEILEAVKTLPLNMGSPEALTDDDMEQSEVQLEVGPAIPTAPELPVDIVPSNLPKTPKNISIPADFMSTQPTLPEEGETPSPLETPSTLPIRTSLVGNRAKSLLEELRESTQTYRGPIEDTKLKEKSEELLNQVTSSVANLAGRNKGRSDDPQAGPAGVSTAYEKGQQRRGSTPSSSNNDDGPSITPPSGPSSTSGTTPPAASAPTADTGGGMTGSDTRPDDPRGEGQYGGSDNSVGTITGGYVEDPDYGLLNKGGLASKKAKVSKNKPNTYRGIAARK